jgi:hypothetical protein
MSLLVNGLSKTGIGGGSMATSFFRNSSSSAFAIVLAYALVILSLWKVDTELAGRGSSTAFEGSGVVKNLAPTNAPDESYSELYRLLVSIPEQSGARSAKNGTEANEEVRRLTALSLILYVTGDGIKR